MTESEDEDDDAADGWVSSHYDPLTAGVSEIALFPRKVGNQRH